MSKGPQNPRRGGRAGGGNEGDSRKALVKHQWKPGQSGNPGGRPRGAKNKPKEASNIDFRKMILEEGRRELVINDAGKPLTVTEAQAVRRAQFISAMKGSERAQRHYLESLRLAESEERQERAEMLMQIGEFKLKWHEEFERWRRNGRKGKAPPIHPDDVVFDPVTSELRIRGPATAEETARWTRYREGCENLLQELAEGQDGRGRRKRELTALLTALGAALGGSREAMLIVEHAEDHLAGMFPDEDLKS